MLLPPRIKAGFQLDAVTIDIVPFATLAVTVFRTGQLGPMPSDF